ncbi:MAG: hypothetical protein JNG86_20540 [Verrucomicrobiaceae bacterium]|nr:hypothetical protein [Verrucomicrobiaceae bacterium]
MKTTITFIISLAVVCGGFAQTAGDNPKQKLHTLLERAHDARAAGRLDEAKELSAQADHLRKELQSHVGIKEARKEPEKHGGKTPPYFKGAAAERLQHIMQAVEHLKAAGLHEPAKNIEEIAQNLRRELQEHMQRQQAAAHADKGKRPGETKAHAELEELRQQMRRMAEQIEQLQAALKKQAP